MEPAILCSEDGHTPAVCSCFCRFPLPTLCLSCLCKHQPDPDVFQHFHLPLCASQWISSKEIRAQYSQWLFTLHSAYGVLKGNEEEVERFQEEIEAVRVEVVYQLEQSVKDAKEKLTGLREAYSEEVKKAISETNAHAMEQWSPESGSLSAKVWLYETSNPASLKPFDLSVAAGSVKQAFQFSIETRLPSLAAFNQIYEAPEQQTLRQLQSDLDQSRRELAEANRKNKALAEENEALKQEIKAIRGKHEAISKDLEELKRNSTSQIRALSDQIVVLHSSQRTAANPPQKEVEERKGTDQPNSTASENEVRREAAELMAKGIADKATFRYQEAALSLQQSWDLLKPFADKQTAGVGVVLAEVLGMHLGKKNEAREVLAKSLEVEMSLEPTSEEVMKLNILKATIACHDADNDETQAICSQTLQTFASLDHSSEHFWVAIYYLAAVYCVSNKIPEAEALISEWVSKPLRNENQFTELLKLSIRGRVLLAKGNYQDAEYQLLKAHKVASSELPTSIYTALNLHWLGKVYTNRKNSNDDAKKMHSEAEFILIRHYSSSIFTASNLRLLATLLNDTFEEEKALQKTLEAHRIYETYFPTSFQTADNLAYMASLYRELKNRKAAVEKRLEAHRIFATCFPTSIHTAFNLSNLADLYREMNKRDLALQKRLEAQRIYEVHFPSNINTADNLMQLAALYCEIEQREVALQKRLEAHLIFAAHYPTDLNTADNLGWLACLYADMGQRELAVQKRLEAHQIYGVHFASNLNTARNLTNLGILYFTQGKLDDSESRYQQARSLHDKHHPTSDNAAFNLYNLALLHEKKRDIESAIMSATSALRIWNNNGSAKAKTLATPLLTRLKAIAK